MPGKGKSIPRTKKPKAAGAKTKKSRVPKRPISYKSYIWRMYKTGNANYRMRNKTLLVLNSMALDLGDRLAAEVGRLLKSGKHQTILEGDVKAAVRLIFPRGELCDGAVSDGGKAVAKYAAATK